MRRGANEPNSEHRERRVAGLQSCGSLTIEIDNRVGHLQTASRCMHDGERCVGSTGNRCVRAVAVVADLNLGDSLSGGDGGSEIARRRRRGRGGRHG